MNQPQIFLSYCRQDAAVARELRERLTAAGGRIWMDVFDIPTGVRWPDAIDRALNASAVVLGVMTPESLESANVKNEWDWAIANGKRLVLVMLRPCRVPFHYVSINYIDAISGLDAAFDELARVLETTTPAMVACPRCGSDVPADARYCPNCAAPLVVPDPILQPEPELPDPLEGLADDVFVGRDHQLEQLRSALQQALAGEPQVALLVGEPGIGKTRLTEVSERIAAHRGAAVLWGRCYEWEGAPAFWPWVQIIRGLASHLEPDQLRADLGAGASDIAQLVPDIALALPDLPLGAPLDAEQLRYRLFDAITTFLRNAARRQPLMLVLDDLHWSDTSSLQLLQYLVRQLGRARLLLLCTYRDVEVTRGDPLAAALADLARSSRTQRVVLRGISREAVRDLIGQMAGSEPSDELTDAIYDATEGNPLFVTEIVRLLVAEERLERVASGDELQRAIPESVREVIGRRLDQLPEAANQMLATASVIGRDFTLPLLERVVEQSAIELLDLLDRAQRARVIDEGERPGSYRFSHALIQDTLYQEFSSTRRLRLHAQVAAALEALHATNLNSVLAELAHHYQLAAPLGYADQAVNYTIRAAQDAARQLAWESAIQLYEQALEVLELLRPDEYTSRCEVYIALGFLRWRIQGVNEGKQDYRRALEFARAKDAPELIARAALGFAGADLYGPLYPTIEGSAHLQEAQIALPDDDSSLLARVIAMRASTLLVDDDLDRRCRMLANDAVAMARRLNDVDTLMFALTQQCWVLGAPGEAFERAAIARELAELARTSGHRLFLASAAMHTIFSSSVIGDRPRFDESNQVLDDLAVQTKEPFLGWMVVWNSVGRNIIAGELGEAENNISTYQSTFAAYTPDELFPAQFGSLALRYLRGTLTATSLMSERLYEPDVALFLTIVRASTLVETGDVHAAAELFSELARHSFQNIPHDADWIVNIALCAQIAAALGDRERGRMLYETLLPFSTLHVAQLGWVLYFGSVSHYLGLLAVMLGDLPAAEEHFEQALASNMTMGARPFVALTQYAYATMLLQRDAPGDRGRAHDLATEALAAAQEIGMARLAEQAKSILN